MDLKKLTKKFICILITGLFLFSFMSQAKAQEPSIELSVDKSSLTTGETFNLSVVFRGGPDVFMVDSINSYLSDFYVIQKYESTNISMFSGVVETIQKLEYVLQPKKAGQLVIGPVEFYLGNKTVRSNSLTVKVEEGGGSSPVVRPTEDPYSTGSTDSRDTSMWVSQDVDKSSVYVNEQVTLTFKFYYRQTFYDPPTYEPPDMTGFSTTSLSQSRGPSVEKVDGVDYYVEEIKTALFPVSSGEKTIGPTILNVPVGLFDMDHLESNEVEVEVKPLPEEGRPDGFSGAVGELIVYPRIDKTETELNEPVTLEVVVEGWCNADNIGDPLLPDLPDFKFYPSGSSKESSIEGSLIYGKKIFKYVLIPTKSGNLEVPEISYSYFNPYDEKYELAKTKPFKIKVLPGENNGSLISSNGQEQEEIKIVGQDINHIKGAYLFSGKSSTFFYQSLFFRIILVILPLILLAGFFYKKYMDRLSSDIGFARFQRSYKNARRNLSQAGKLIKDEKEEEFYSLISRTLAEYMGDKFNLPSAGITLEDISEILKEKEVEKELIELFQKCYESCEFARFAPGNSTGEKMKQTYELTEKLLISLEKKKLK